MYTVESFITPRIRTELLGGVLAFCATAPAVFATVLLTEQIGWDQEATFTALCLSAGYTTLITSWILRMPVVCAPNIGLISLFIFSMSFGAGISRESILIIFGMSGVCLLMLSVVRGGSALIRAIPACLYPALTGGIGLLLIGIGLRKAGILVAHPVALVVIGNLTARAPVIVGIGVLATCVAMTRHWRYPLFIGCAVAFLVGGIVGVVPFDQAGLMPVWDLTVYNPVESFGVFETEALRFLPTIMIVIIMETAGVFVGLQAILERDPIEASPGSHRIWLCLGAAGIVSPALGVPAPTVSPEGLIGGISGGKTWITGLVAGCLFLVCPIFPFLIQIFGMGYQVGSNQWLHPLVAPLLIAGGLSCLIVLRQIDWKRPEEFIPAGIVLTLTPLSFSIVNGLSLGLIMYVVIRVLQGNTRELSPLYLIIIPLLVLRYLVL